MMEPILSGKAICDVALPLVTRCLDEAARKGNGLRDRCVGYLRASQMVVDSLHKEFESLDEQAELCDLEDPKKVETLRINLHHYLYTNTLRPQLWTALEGMRDCRTVLQERVDSILNLPWGQNEKRGAVAEFVETTGQLETYMASLGYEYPSGVGLEMLNELYEGVRGRSARIETTLGDSKPVRIELKQITSNPRLMKSLTERRELTARIERTINRIIESF